MLTTDRPITPPPASHVAGVHPGAAEAIDRLRDFERSLPPRRSAEQLDQLDALRIAAFNELNTAEFLDSLAREEEELRSRLVDRVAELRPDWFRLETIRALRKWPSQPDGFAPRPIPCLTFSLGNGYQKTVTGQELIAALADTVGGH